MSWESLSEIGRAYRSGEIDKEQFEDALKWWRTTHPKRDVTPRPQHEWADIVDLRARGSSLAEIAKKYGVTPSRISQILSRPPASR